jgi:hypothetical protein
VIWVSSAQDLRGPTGGMIVCYYRATRQSCGKHPVCLTVSSTFGGGPSSKEFGSCSIMCCFTSGYGKPEEMFEAWWQCKEGFSQVVRQVWKERFGIQVPWGILKAKIFKSKTACKHWRQVHANPTD